MTFTLTLKRGELVGTAWEMLTVKSELYLHSKITSPNISIPFLHTVKILLTDISLSTHFSLSLSSVYPGCLFITKAWENKKCSTTRREAWVGFSGITESYSTNPSFRSFEKLISIQNVCCCSPSFALVSFVWAHSIFFFASPERRSLSYLTSL